MWAARNPVPALEGTAPWVVPDHPEDERPELRADIGQSTFLIVAVLAGALVVLFAL